MNLSVIGITVINISLNMFFKSCGEKSFLAMRFYHRRQARQEEGPGFFASIKLVHIPH